MRLISTVRGALKAFAAREASGALLLLAATAVALVWANAGAQGYEAFWNARLSVHLGPWGIDMPLRHWINDGLMMMFFLLVSLQVKHDFVMGGLREWRRACVPVLAAACGLVVPAVVFGVINAGGPHAGAWGIVIPTDTAFVVGILAAFGKRLPVQLRSFLVTLAVVDDVGALAVIATAYTGTIRLLPLVGVLLAASALYAVQRARVRRASVYIVFGALLWLLFLASGVHAAIAGVVLGLLMPVFPPERSALLTAEELTQRFRRAPTALTGKNAVYGILRAVSINERHQLSMAPIVNLIVVPVFALSNAGVALSGDALAHALHSPLTWGIVAGLVAGKYVGAFGASVLASKTRIGELAPGLGLRHINGGAMLTGIGFTISLFIIDLAIEDGAAQADARIGVLAASLLAALLGALVLALTAFLDARRAPARPRLTRPVDPRRDHIAGNPASALTLVQYGQLGCLEDGATVELLREVRDHFDNDLRLVFRHNPLGDPGAEQAAEMLEAVAAQSPDLFEPVRVEVARLCDEADLDRDVLRRAAVEMGADLARLDAQMLQRPHIGRVHDDADDAASMGLTRAPAFFIGEELYQGEHTPEALIEALEAARAALDPRTPARTAGEHD